jgi:hypothetical protein
MTSTLPRGTLGSVASLLAASLYQGNPGRNRNFWNTLSDASQFSSFFFKRTFWYAMMMRERCLLKVFHPKGISK